MSDKKKAASPHKLTLDNRERLFIAGVLEVPSSNETVVTAVTETGAVTIRGANLHINELSLEKSTLGIDGRVDSIVYSDKGAAKSLMAKLFR